MKSNLFKIVGSISSIFLFGVSNSAEAMMAKQFAREGSRFVTRTLHDVPMKHIIQPFVVPNYAIKQQMRFESSSEQKKEKQKKEEQKIGRDDDIIDDLINPLTSPLHPWHPLSITGSFHPLHPRYPYNNSYAHYEGSSVTAVKDSSLGDSGVIGNLKSKQSDTVASNGGDVKEGLSSRSSISSSFSSEGSSSSDSLWSHDSSDCDD